MSRHFSAAEPLHPASSSTTSSHLVTIGPTQILCRSLRVPSPCLSWNIAWNSVVFRNFWWETWLQRVVPQLCSQASLPSCLTRHFPYKATSAHNGTIASKSLVKAWQTDGASRLCAYYQKNPGLAPVTLVQCRKSHVYPERRRGKPNETQKQNVGGIDASRSHTSSLSCPQFWVFIIMLLSVKTEMIF